MKVVAIIPAFNEAKRIGALLPDVASQVDEIIVVDDGSTDTTYETAQGFAKVKPLRHRVNLGKGAALKTGCDYAVERGADVLVCLDADGQHLPAEIPHLIQPIFDGHAALVFGSRILTAGRQMPFVAKIGNRFLSFTATLLFGITISDTQSGYRAFTRETYQKIRWDSSSYAVETEMIVRAGKQRIRSKEISISTVYLDRYKGTTIFDGLRIFLSMLLWKIR